MNEIRNSGQAHCAAIFFDAVAQHIVAQHPQEIPDLRRAVVLLPNYHVAQPLAQSLARAAKSPALLLPQMVTLNDWAQTVTLAQTITPDSCRATALYQALRTRRWFPDADLWGITQELLALLHELTQNQVTLPQNEADFVVHLEQAYQAKRGVAMQFEARLVHELWYAMSSAGELDSAGAYQQRLAQLAQQASAPLTVLMTSDLAAPEARFIEAYRERAPVTIFDLRELAAHQPACAALVSLSSPLTQPEEERGGPPSLRDQATHLRKHFPQGSLSQRLRLFGAHGLEQEAGAAEMQVRRCLLEGKKNIAIVAQDRLVARRVRALLERAEILVSDETGWTFSTLSVSTVLMRWLDALQSDFYYQDLLDLLKSPFIFADQAASERKQAVYQLEQLVRKRGVSVHLEAFIELSQGEAEVQSSLVRLRQAAELLRKKSDTLSGWLSALHDSLEILGILHGLEGDDAGVQLLQALHTWQRELQADTTRFSLPEWRHWLTQQLDAHTFHDTSITSPVLLTHLTATRWRSFDAVLLLGCDADHLPGSERNGLWFNDAVRAALGLPTRAANLAQQSDDLMALLAMNTTVLVTWQTSTNGEANLLSPYLEMLRTLHELAYGDDLADQELGALVEHAQVRSAEFALPHAAVMPAPQVEPGLIPGRISVSGYNSLVACPYQFYARHILRLNELDEVREGVEKRDYGEWAHSILHRFHQQYPVLAQHGHEQLSSALHRISDEEFAPAIQRDYLARAWLQRWKQAIPVYIESQLQSEEEGWRFQKGEDSFELPVTDTVLLHGRVDRVDAQAAKGGALRVLDYKMMDANRLRNKLKEAGEDVQLPCYAYAYQAGEAAYISIEKDKVAAVAPMQDLPELARANMERLRTVFTQMHGGTALPAHGVEEACAYCEMRGLCRKGEWPPSLDPSPDGRGRISPSPSGGRVGKGESNE